MGSREGDSVIEVSSGGEAQQPADFNSATDTQTDSAYGGDIPEHPVNDQISDDGNGNDDNDGSHQGEVNIRDERNIRDGENHQNAENQHDDGDVSGDGERENRVINDNDDTSRDNPQGDGVNNPEGGRPDGGFEAICQGVENLPNNEKAPRFLRTHCIKPGHSVSSCHQRTNPSSDSERKSSISDEESEDSNIAAADSEGEDALSCDADSQGINRLHKLVTEHQYKKVQRRMQQLTTVDKHMMIGMRNEKGETLLDVKQTRRMAYLLVSGVNDPNMSNELIEECKIFGVFDSIVEFTGSSITLADLLCRTALKSASNGTLGEFHYVDPDIVYKSHDYELWIDAEKNTIMHLAAAIGHERMIKDALINGYPLEFLRKTNKDRHVPYDLKKNHATGNLLAWAETLGPKSYPLIVPPSFIVSVCVKDMPGLEQDISSLTAAAKEFGTVAEIKRNPTEKEIHRLLQGEQSRDLSAVIVVLICHSISRGSILVQNQPVAIQDLLHDLNPEKKKGIPKILIIQRWENPAAYKEHPDKAGKATGYNTHAPDMAVLDIRNHGHKSWSISVLTESVIKSDGDALYHIYKEIVKSMTKVDAKRSGLPPSIDIKTSFRAYLRLKKVYKEDFDYEDERAAKASHSCPIEDEHQGSC